tara:strand:- start:602 stop:961 length:360 start_codon:yes stop_codon:yes gene_type:complete
MPTTYTERAYKAQERKAKMGWAKYFALLNEQHERDLVAVTILKEVVVKEMPEHVRVELVALLTEAKKKIDCPICLDEIPPGEIDMTQCGHKFCKTCLAQVKSQPDPKCSICRTKIYVPQ